MIFAIFSRFYTNFEKFYCYFNLAFAELYAMLYMQNMADFAIFCIVIL